MWETINEKVIVTLPLRKTIYVEWDKSLPCFGCVVRPSGAKSYIVQYYEGGRGSKQIKITLGKVGLISYAKAKEAAKQILIKRKLANVGAISNTDYFE